MNAYKQNLVHMLINLVFIGFLLFSFAGTLDWWRAWVFLAVSLCGSLVLLYSLRTHEQILVERANISLIQPGQPIADRIVIFLFLFSYIYMILLIPLDRFRFHLMPKPGLFWSSIGLLHYLAGGWIIYLVFWENRFAAPVVKHLTEKGHKVIDTGVYSIVRHPMYAGIILMVIGMPLWLESYAALLFALIPIALLIIRIFIEEAFLKVHLSGYKAYMHKVPYRLIPYLW